MKKGIIRKVLVFSIIILLVGVSISSVTSKDISISNMDNQNPSSPMISGKHQGNTNIEYTFTFNSIDPDGDDVRYIIDWGDGTSDTTSFTGSGMDMDASHIWEVEGTYTISASAEDIHDLVGPENTHHIGISRSKDNDEDCIECQTSDGISLLKAKILLFRVKVVTNVILSSELGDIPEIKESCQEILNIINSDLERPICVLLENLLLLNNEYGEYLFNISKSIPDNRFGQLFQVLFMSILLFNLFISLSIVSAGLNLGCGDLLPE